MKNKKIAYFLEPPRPPRKRALFFMKNPSPPRIRYLFFMKTDTHATFRLLYIAFKTFFKLTAKLEYLVDIAVRFY